MLAGRVPVRVVLGAVTAAQRPELRRAMSGGSAAAAAAGGAPHKGHPRTRYKYWVPMQTQWHHNDMYGHVNNMWYVGYFDTVINKWLQEQAGQQPMSSPVVGLCVESGCRYFSSLEFPNVVEAGLFVSHTGRSSLRYEVGIFQQGKDECAAHGHFVHVFVDAKTRRPTPIPHQVMSKVQSSLL